MRNQTIFELYTDDHKSKYSSNLMDILKCAKKLWNYPPSELPQLLLLNLFGKLLTERKDLINIDDIIKSINSETNNKPPGNDGLTAEFYRHFSNELAPALLGVYDSWGKLDTMGVTYRRGIISAIRAISRTNYFQKTGGHPKWEVPK